MPGSMFSWESEDMLVDEYEAAIKENREPSVAMHFAGLVIAVALHQRDEDWRQHSLPQTSLRGYLRTTLRALDALPIIAKNVLKQNKSFMIPGIVQLKVSGMRPKKAAKPNSNQSTKEKLTVKVFPSRALKVAALRGGSSSSSSETLQLPSPPSPSPPSPQSWASNLACWVERGRKRKKDEE